MKILQVSHYDANSNTVLDKQYISTSLSNSEVGSIMPTKEFYSIQREQLVKLYHDQKLSFRKISKMYGVSSHTVGLHFRRLNIVSRVRAEIMAQKWRDGVFSNKHNRVKYICEWCGKEKEQHYCEYRRSEHHYCSNKCSHLALSTLIISRRKRGQENEEKWLSQQPNRERIFKSEKLPDFLEIREDGSIIFYEIKTKSSIYRNRTGLTNSQIEVIKRLQKLNVRVEVVSVE